MIKCRLNNKKLFDLKLILKKLYFLGIRNLLVEGGDKITNDFLENKLFNQFYLFKSPINLSKKTNYLGFTSLKTLSKNYNKKTKVSFKLVRDKITIYKR